MSPSLPEARGSVLMDVLVFGENREVTLEGLCDQDAIERIAVNGRQGLGAQMSVISIGRIVMPNRSLCSSR
jgi:hypothetical protein